MYFDFAQEKFRLYNYDIQCYVNKGQYIINSSTDRKYLIMTSDLCQFACHLER